MLISREVEPEMALKRVNMLRASETSLNECSGEVVEIGMIGSHLAFKCGG
jgi:hypothetical protein